MGKLFDGKLVFTQIPLLLKYLPVTMELAVTAMIASLILGLLLALVKIKKVPVLKQLVSIYISVIRGTPVLVQLYVTYFGIPMLLKYINFKCGTNYNVNGVAPIVYAFDLQENRRLMTVLTIWYLTVWTGWKKGLQTRDTYLVTD